MEVKIFIHITQCKHMGDQRRISMYSLNSAVDGCQWLPPCSVTSLQGESLRYLVDKWLGVFSLEVDVNSKIPAGAG